MRLMLTEEEGGEHADEFRLFLDRSGCHPLLVHFRRGHEVSQQRNWSKLKTQNLETAFEPF